ncbi:MAG: rhodanese-like domain-containing protein [Myxococcota bacterium]|nr:rhodanese-like domain-containing protein [Myxococcota bacterium]
MSWLRSLFGGGKDEELPSDATTEITLPLNLPESFDPRLVLVEAEEVYADLHTGQQVTFIDVRERRAFRKGHITKSEHVPLLDLPEFIPRAPPRDRLVLYCETGHHSQRGALYLRSNGLHDAWSIKGGLQAWKKVGGTMADD